MCLFVCPLGLHKAAISSVFVHPVVVSERPNAAALTGQRRMCSVAAQQLNLMWWSINVCSDITVNQ